MFWHLNNLILIPSLITNNCTKIEIGWEFVHDESNPSCISLLWIQMFKSVTRQALFETTQTNIRKRLSPCFLPLGLHFLSLCTSFYVYFQLLQNSCKWFVGYIYIYIYFETCVEDKNFMLYDFILLATYTTSTNYKF